MSWINQQLLLIPLLACADLASASVPPLTPMTGPLTQPISLGLDVTLPQPDGSQAVLGRSGAIGSAAVDRVQVMTDASGTVRLLSGSSTVVLGIANRAVQEPSGVSLTSGDGRGVAVGLIRLVSSGDPEQFSTDTGRLSCQMAGGGQGIMSQITFVTEMDNEYQFDFASGQGSIRFLLPTFKDPRGLWTNCYVNP